MHGRFSTVHHSRCHVKICIQSKMIMAYGHRANLVTEELKNVLKECHRKCIKHKRHPILFVLYWPIEGTTKGCLLRWEWIRLPPSRSWRPPAGLFVWNTQKRKHLQILSIHDVITYSVYDCIHFFLNSHNWTNFISTNSCRTHRQALKRRHIDSHWNTYKPMEDTAVLKWSCYSSYGPEFSFVRHGKH